MIWVRDIKDLQYYKPTHGLPCYCELLVNPEDLLLQAYMGNYMYGEIFSTTVKIEVYSPDGKTNYGDATSDFRWSVIRDKTGDVYANIQLWGNYSQYMYEKEGFILKVTITAAMGLNTHRKVFEAYTERYCGVCCPASPSEINISDV